MVLLGLEVLFGIPLLLNREIPSAEAIVLLMVSYVLGQIVGELAQILLEDVNVHRWLKQPLSWLLAQETPRLAKVDAFFLHVRFHRETTTNDVLMARLGTFLSQYGFSRNMCLACASTGVVLLIAARSNHALNLLHFAGFALAVSVAMFFRYLKFYRQYSFELLNWYGGFRQ